MKYVLLVIMLSLNSCLAQNNNPISKNVALTDSLSFISNERIRYSIVLKSCDTCVPISNIGYRISVQLTQKERDDINSINFETWKILLKNNKTNWAANLILYDKYDKDAFLFLQIDSFEVWNKSFKENDILYWNDILR